MKENQVVLSLDEYNFLRDFKINIEEGNVYVIKNHPGCYGIRIFSKKDKVIAECEEINSDLNNENNKLRIEVGSLKEDVRYYKNSFNMEKEETLRLLRLKDITVRQFRRWMCKNKTI